MKKLNLKKVASILLILILAIGLFWWGYQMGKADVFSDSASAVEMSTEE